SIHRRKPPPLRLEETSRLFQGTKVDELAAEGVSERRRGGAFRRGSGAPERDQGRGRARSRASHGPVRRGRRSAAARRDGIIAGSYETNWCAFWTGEDFSAGAGRTDQRGWGRGRHGGACASGRSVVGDAEEV